MLTACIGHLGFHSTPSETENDNEEEMTFNIESSVVVDDAFGPPALGQVSSEDKSKWIDYIVESRAGEAAIRTILHDGAGPDMDTLLTESTSDHVTMVKLWDAHKGNQQPDANLALLFGIAELDLQGKVSTPQVVVDKLVELCGSEKVKTFFNMESAVGALATADIAFVDFYLRDGEEDADAIARIKKYAETLKKVKLLFIMSSRATLEDQQIVRRIVGLRSAFFDVLRKQDITPEFLDSRISRKRDPYVGNKSLEEVIEALVEATTTAVTEFKAQCEDMEVHDLRILDLARLTAEGESIPEYLTWLFSEAIAAKTRRMALPSALKGKIEADDIGFSGQILQGRALFDLFAQVVFGPPIPAHSPLRFGELLMEKSDKKHILILSPACDLQRCEPTRSVLCVWATSTTYTNYKELVENKLYGKLNGGVRHLYCCTDKEGQSKYVMLAWQFDEIVTYTVQALQGDKFERIALMNEIFAQEVKEEVLRKLGRVGTQIDPPPPIALNAKLRWKITGDTPREANTPHDSFISALLTYAEELKEGKTTSQPSRAVVLSDAFKDWAEKEILESFGVASMPAKFQNCINSIRQKKLFVLRNTLSVAEGDLQIKVVSPDDLGAMEKGLVEIALLMPDIEAKQDPEILSGAHL